MGLPGKRKKSETAKKVHACSGGRQGEDEMEAEDLLWRPVTRERRSCRLLLVLSGDLKKNNLMNYRIYNELI